MSNVEVRENSDNEFTVDIVPVVKALWKNAWIMIASTLIAGILAYCVTRFMMTPMYECSFTAYINNRSENISIQDYSMGLSTGDLQASRTLATTYIEVLTSRSLLMEACDNAGLDYSLKKLQKAVTAESVNDTEILEISVKLNNAQDASALAAAVEKLAPDYVAKVVDGSSMQVMDAAYLKEKPVSPSFPINMAVSMLLGFVISAVSIVVWSISNDVIDNEEELVARMNVTIVGTIPDLVEARKKDYGYGYGYGRNK